jgi:uncharacterized membrane protein
MFDLIQELGWFYSGLSVLLVCLFLIWYDNRK